MQLQVKNLTRSLRRSKGEADNLKKQLKQLRSEDWRPTKLSTQSYGKDSQNDDKVHDTLNYGLDDGIFFDCESEPNYPDSDMATTAVPPTTQVFSISASDRGPDDEDTNDSSYECDWNLQDQPQAECGETSQPPEDKEPFQLWLQEQKQRIAEELQTNSFATIAKAAADKWKTLDQEVKDGFARRSDLMNNLVWTAPSTSKPGALPDFHTRMSTSESKPLLAPKRNG